MAVTSVDRLKKKFEPQIKHILQGVVEAARDEGLVTTGEVDDQGYEDYSWSVYILPPNRDPELEAEVKITMAESEHWDGEKGGVNFMFDVDDREEKIGGMVPYNYTSEVWVRRSKPEDVQHRLREFDQGIDPGYVVETIVERFKKRGGFGAPIAPGQTKMFGNRRPPRRR